MSEQLLNLEESFEISLDGVLKFPWVFLPEFCQPIDEPWDFRGVVSSEGCVAINEESVLRDAFECFQEVFSWAFGIESQREEDFWQF